MTDHKKSPMGNTYDPQLLGSPGKLYVATNNDDPEKNTVVDQANDAILTSDSEAIDSTTVPASRPRKSFSFYLAVLSMMLVIFILSVDATALSVAIPVSYSVVDLGFRTNRNDRILT